MDGALTADGNFAHNNTVAPAATRVLPLFSLVGRTAVVSGAGAGIGLAVAQGLAEAGANVAIWYNSNAQAVVEAENIAKTYGVKCKAYKVNINSYESITTTLSTSIHDLNSRLDIFIANSGICWTEGSMLEGSLTHYRDVITTDLDGTFYCARAAGLHWRRQKKEGTDLEGKVLVPRFREGSFVATASMSGSIVNVPQLQTAYNAAKAGVIHMCRSLAIEWVGFARANSISPGYINTEISKFCSQETKDIWKNKIPMGREGETSELKGAYLYLASDASSYTTGLDMIVDGGYCLT